MADLSQLIRKRGAIKHKLTNFNTHLKPVKESYEKNNVINEQVIIDIQWRTQRFEQLFDEFEEVQQNIEYLTAEDKLDEQYNERDTFTETYSENLAAAKLLLMKCNIKSDNAAGTEVQSNAINILTESHQNVKLPMINLPKFSGSYSDWLEFKETYKSLIHLNPSIGTIQKFHYLRASLEGDAKKVIQALEFSPENYTLAWNTLCNRYNNSRLLVHNHIKGLFQLDSLWKESAVGLRTLGDNIFKHLGALSSLKQPHECFDAVIIYVITSKLDKFSTREWESFIREKESPNLDDMKQFLASRAEFLESLDMSFQDKGNKETKEAKRNIRQTSLVVSDAKCFFCGGSHLMYSCEKFLTLDIPKRIEKVKGLKLCINCFRKGHQKRDCKSGNCKTCNEKHNSLLHEEKREQKQEVSLPAMTQQSYVLLSTAVVLVKNGNIMRPCRALLDSGSQSNFISKNLCEELKLKTSRTNIAITGINKVESEIKHQCQISIASQYYHYTAEMDCFVIPRITEDLPSSGLDISTWKIPERVKLADPKFNETAPIDILIGAGMFWSLMTNRKIVLGKNLPILQHTKLGWILAGEVIGPQIHYAHCNLALEKQMREFWEIEEVLSEKELSLEEIACETHFQQNTQRDQDGRFIVKIPLKTSPEILGDTKEGAMRRFYSLEKKLESNRELKESYIHFMTEYEELGHMSKTLEAEKMYYLPHHGVLKEESITTKMRVVFDGSFKSSNGTSINDIQMVGATIQDELFSILLRFRQHDYVVSADIAKMYRQVLIHPEHRKLQCILWRADPSDNLQTYQLNTVTYGTSAASFLAIRSLHELAIENAARHPRSCKIIQRDFYVDDLLTGFDSIEEARQITKEISNILKEGCLQLRKWISNEPDIIHDFADEMTPASVLSLGKNENTKALGLLWSSTEDLLFYTINSRNLNCKITKRTVLSNISKIYDPLGLLSACIITAKIFLKRLWQERLDWDELLPNNLRDQWIRYTQEMLHLNVIRIPRQVTRKMSKYKEIHAFSDASQEAYGACVYIRSIDYENDCQVNLLCAKSRVSPTKKITIPRLELCGALLLSRLVKKVKAALDSTIATHYWCDSMVVLCWLKRPALQLKPFVGNRISEIQQSTDIEDWHYVSSLDNPADLLSRGVSPHALRHSDMWWHGPSWLKQEISLWPAMKVQTIDVELPELRSKVSLIIHERIETIEIKKYSNYNTLVRVTAYVLRFIHNTKHPTQALKGFLSTSEIESSTEFLVKQVQACNFQTEISLLSRNKPLNANSKLLRLNPFIDASGVLRVGGRLSYSRMDYNQKHPMILPAKHHFTLILFKTEHLRLLHPGTAHLLASIRERFWPLSGRSTSRKVSHECISCFRARPKSYQPIMSALPQERTAIGFPFINTGMDYAGPFFLKTKRGRGARLYKCYICLFICFSTKAVHIEHVSDLTKEAFIAALRRFISRRGRPLNLYSDNATNFVGGRNELSELGKFLRKSRTSLQEDCSRENINWHFIPPHSPHFGGLWEAGIKSVKHHLKRVLGCSHLCLEDFVTLITQIEAILNSRPLHPLSSDPNDISSLTPAHFIIGRTLTTVVDPSLDKVSVNRLSTYQQIQLLRQQFWKRWSRHYIAELQQRQKWNTQTKNIEIGSLVLVKEDNQPPQSWKLGRIEAVHPGQDDIVRVVTVKTAKGSIKRAVAKICPVPSEIN